MDHRTADTFQMFSIKKRCPMKKTLVSLRVYRKLMKPRMIRYVSWTFLKRIIISHPTIPNFKGKCLE